MSAQGKPAAAAGTALGWRVRRVRTLKGCRSIHLNCQRTAEIPAPFQGALEFGKSPIPEGSPKIAHRFNGGKAIVVQIDFS